MIARENSRRHTNNILKPQSELDLTLFGNNDRVTPKYYCLPNDFPTPICSGRYTDPALSKVLNDRYCSISSGSENFRFRTRYEYEQKLFDNEDSMYSFDHEILQYKTVLKNLNKELPLATSWEQQKQEERTPLYKPTFLSKVSLTIIDRLYAEKSTLSAKVNVTQNIVNKPKQLLEVFIPRFTQNLQKLEEEKAERLQSWRLCCV